MPSAILVNFAGGETSPKSRGRFDIQSYSSSCKKLVNFIAEVSGPARFRPGFRHLAETRSSGAARLIPFHLSDEQAYMLEFTPGKMRVYKDGALYTEPRTTITAVTQANPAVITVAATTNLANGDEVIISGIVGMTELNGRQVKLAGASGSTFQLVDPTTGDNINSTGFGAYVSGGTLVEVYEIATQYTLERDIPGLQFVQAGGDLFIVHPRHLTRRLSVVGDNWTMSQFILTNSPFVTGSAVGISSIETETVAGVPYGLVRFTAANAASITPGEVYYFQDVVGTTQVNTNFYRLENPRTVYGGGSSVFVDFELYERTLHTRIDASGFSPYVSGGTVVRTADNPLGCTCYESRLIFAGSPVRPRTIFASRSPASTTGATQYADFTGGTDADHACFFSLAPVNGSQDYITWAGGTNKYLLVGTSGGPFRVSGSGLEEPITPSSINVRQLDSYGCAAAMPALNGSLAYYIQRGGKTLRGIKYDADVDDFASFDMCLNAEQIGDYELKRVVFQANRPDALWVVRADGMLASCTIQNGERIAGWHRHKIGGTDAKVIDVAILPRPGDNDQIYVVTERTVNGATRRSVEVMADDVIFPDPEDFFTAESAQAANETDYMDAVYRLQERYIHVDAAATYNGSAAGTAAGAALTLSAATVGAGRTFTASAAVFSAADVGKEIWLKPSATTGVGAGRAEITAFTSTTVVTATITVAFSATAVPAGDWYLAADEISGLWHLEGERVAVVADGAVYSDGKTADYPTVTVASGAIALSRNCAVVHVGLPYEGMLITHNLEMGGQSGPAQDKPRNIARMVLRFLNSLGCEYGTDLYHTEKVVHNSNKYVSDRPTPVFSGQKIVHNSDDWRPDSGDKNVVVVQKLPLPCVLQFVGVYYDIGDEG